MENIHIWNFEESQRRKKSQPPSISHVETSCCNILPKWILCLSHKDLRTAQGNAIAQPSKTVRVTFSSPSHSVNTFRLSKNSLNKLSLIYCFLTWSFVRDIFQLLLPTKNLFNKHRLLFSPYVQQLIQSHK